MSALAIIVYCFCGLIPLSAILSQFIGNHRKFNIGGFITSFLALVTGGLLAGWNQMSLELDGEPSVGIIWISVILSVFLWFLQQETPRLSNNRVTFNLLGLGGIFCLFFWLMMTAMWTGGAVETKRFQQETTQEGRNSYYTQKEFESEFGFSLPKFDVVDYEWYDMGPDYEITVKVIPSEPLDSTYLIQQVNLNKNGLDSISFKNGKFYGYKERRYDCSITYLPNDTLLIKYGTY